MAHLTKITKIVYTALNSLKYLYKSYNLGLSQGRNEISKSIPYTKEPYNDYSLFGFVAPDSKG